VSGTTIAVEEKEPEMNRSAANKTTAKHPLGTDAEGILQELTTRQHLAPHRPLSEVVAETVAAAGVCPAAAERALGWLNLQPDRSIGRLRRGELIQLARSMYRFWMESLSAEHSGAGASNPR
jgi:hypothetical protein